MKPTLVNLTKLVDSLDIEDFQTLAAAVEDRKRVNQQFPPRSYTYGKAQFPYDHCCICHAQFKAGDDNYTFFTKDSSGLSPSFVMRTRHAKCDR